MLRRRPPSDPGPRKRAHGTRAAALLSPVLTGSSSRVWVTISARCRRAPRSHFILTGRGGQCQSRREPGLSARVTKPPAWARATGRASASRSRRGTGAGRSGLRRQRHRRRGERADGHRDNQRDGQKDGQRVRQKDRQISGQKDGRRCRPTWEACQNGMSSSMSSNPVDDLAGGRLAGARGAGALRGAGSPRSSPPPIDERPPPPPPPPPPLRA